MAVSVIELLGLSLGTVRAIRQCCEEAQVSWRDGRAMKLPAKLELNHRAVFEFHRIEVFENLSPTEFLGLPVTVINGPLTECRATLYTMEIPYEKTDPRLLSLCDRLIGGCREFEQLLCALGDRIHT